MVLPLQAPLRDLARRAALRGALVYPACCWGAVAMGCDARPDTNVVFENHFPPSTTGALVIYKAKWQAVVLDASVLPGAASDPQTTAPASGNTAYVVIAPGWGPDAGGSPTSRMVLQSRGQFAVHLDDTLHIPVDDSTFTGNCAAGSPLTQAQADFITQFVFPGEFTYDAATCSATLLGDAGAL